MKTLCIFLCLLIPITATATPCATEHVATAGKPAACSGIISPALTAIDGARCIDYALPTCNATATRDALTCARRAVLLSRDVTESNARADRWRALALSPAPALPPKIVIRHRGVQPWLVAALFATGSAFSAYLAYKAGRAAN